MFVIKRIEVLKYFTMEVNGDQQLFGYQHS